MSRQLSGRAGSPLTVCSDQGRRASVKGMGLDDKIDNKTEDLGGKAKETVGKATGDEGLERQGKTDQSKSDLKQAGEKVKDAFKK
jgi:uncharacterized protein YjbJ (UPF0337 family)